MKKILIVILVLVCAAFLALTVLHDPLRRWFTSPGTVICRVGDQTLTLKEANAFVDFTLITNDRMRSLETNEDLRSDYESALFYFKRTMFATAKATELKLYPLSEDEMRAVDTKTETLYSKYTKEFEAAGITREYIKQALVDSEVIQFLDNRIYQDSAVTNEDVKAQYDSLLAGQKAKFDGDARSYEDFIIQSLGYDAPFNTPPEVLVYRPEGFRTVRQVLIPFSHDAAQMIENAALPLEDVGLANNPIDNGQSSAAQAQAEEQIQKLMEENLPLIRTQAEEALAKAQAGEDFDKLLSMAISGYYPADVEPPDQKNEFVLPSNEVKYTNFMFTDYDIGPESRLDPFFVEAVHSLKNVGDMTGLVASRHGYHIIKWVGIAPSGPIPFDKVKDNIAKSMQTNKARSAWDAAYDRWKAAIIIEEFTDRIPY